MILLLLVWSAVAGMTLNMESAEVNGLQLRSMQCDLNSGGLMASIAVVASLAEQKPALDACAPEGAAARVTWTWKDGKVVETAVLDIDGKVEKSCVLAALKRTSSGFDGACKAVVLMGAPEGAEKSASVLVPPPPPVPEAAVEEGPVEAPPATPEPAAPPKKRGIGF